jgi:hypothetical protein
MAKVSYTPPKNPEPRDPKLENMILQNIYAEHHCYPGEVCYCKDCEEYRARKGINGTQGS